MLKEQEEKNKLLGQEGFSNETPQLSDSGGGDWFRGS